MAMQLHLVNPIHGGGIGPSMLSGYFAGQQIVEALNKGEPTKEALWGYNKRYIDTYGKKQGTLDIFKMFLLSCSDDDLNYGMNQKLMTEDDVLKAGMGDDFKLNITETAKRVFRGIRKVGFLNKLHLTVTMMRGLSAHYNTYPTTPEGFEAWRDQTVKLIEEGKQKLQLKQTNLFLLTMRSLILFVSSHFKFSFSKSNVFIDSIFFLTNQIV